MRREMGDRGEHRERDQRMLTEIPSSLKQLARLVVRGFYTIEDALIIDMLVRNPCKLSFSFVGLFYNNRIFQA